MHREEIKKKLEFFRNKTDSETIVKFRGMIMSRKDAKDLRDHYCGGCGMEKPKPCKYFGEMFCEECYEKFRRGSK